MHCDTIVLGAGIVGVSTALQLQARGRSVVLLDRAMPGSGTSHGNAGLIERASVIPYSFPREISRLLRYGLNQQSDVRYSLKHLPKAGPWLLKYWQQSAPKELAKYIAHKGSITVDGTSLTVNAVNGAEFSLTIIPHTLSETIMGDYRPGRRVNLEVDLLARYLERLLLGDKAAEPTSGGISESFLAANGFLKS